MPADQDAFVHLPGEERAAAALGSREKRNVAAVEQPAVGSD